MEQSSSWESDSRSAFQKISRLLWNLKVPYRVQKSSPPVHILCQMNPVHSLTPYLFNMHYDIFSSIYVCVLQVISSSHVLQPKFCIYFSFLPCIRVFVSFFDSCFKNYDTNDDFRSSVWEFRVINPLKPSGNYMSHLLFQPITQHFVILGFVWFSVWTAIISSNTIKTPSLSWRRVVFSLRYGLSF
jgi:hypothetical protein